MTNQYEPFLPTDFDPTNAEVVQICLDRVNPMVNPLEDTLNYYLRVHALLHSRGLHNTEEHDTCLAQINFLDNELDKVRMAIWS